MSKLSIRTKSGTELEPFDADGLRHHDAARSSEQCALFIHALCGAQVECSPTDLKPWEVFLARFYLTLLEDYFLQRKLSARVEGLQTMLPSLLGPQPLSVSVEEHKYQHIEIYRREDLCTIWIPPEQIWHEAGLTWINQLKRDEVNANPFRLTGIGRVDNPNFVSLTRNIRETKGLKIDNRVSREGLLRIETDILASP